MFGIINNIDSQLEQANIRVKHWQITLTVIVLTLITFDYIELYVYTVRHNKPFQAVTTLSINLLFMWTILFLLIIHKRFVCLNRLLKENATTTTTDIQIVGARNPRDNYMLRRITLARHVHEQLTEVVQLFSDTCRYVIVGFITIPVIQLIFNLLHAFISTASHTFHVQSIFVHGIKIVVLIGICQANKAERRVLTSRIRHLLAYETDREIILQLQQYIMYNAYSVQGLIDLQFTDIDNVLLLTIIDIVVSNILIIYSYTRDGTEFMNN